MPHTLVHRATISRDQLLCVYLHRDKVRVNNAPYRAADTDKVFRFVNILEDGKSQFTERAGPSHPDGIWNKRFGIERFEQNILLLSKPT